MLAVPVSSDSGGPGEGPHSRSWCPASSCSLEAALSGFPYPGGELLIKGSGLWQATSYRVHALVFSESQHSNQKDGLQDAAGNLETQHRYSETSLSLAIEHIFGVILSYIYFTSIVLIGKSNLDY